MTDDIVARLRDLDIYDDVTIGATIDEAADEIERLRAALTNLLNLDQRCGWYSKEADAAIALLKGTSHD